MINLVSSTLVYFLSEPSALSSLIYFPPADQIFHLEVVNLTVLGTGWEKGLRGGRSCLNTQYVNVHLILLFSIRYPYFNCVCD